MPVLEAICCGAAVIGSNVTSIPEVIGDKNALFDPFSISSMTEKMQEALTSQEFLKELKVNANKQKNKFSWNISAQKAVQALLGFEDKTQKVQPIAVDKLISDIKMNYEFDDENHIKIANAIAYNNRVFAKPQLLVDISELVRVDAKSGIQRVVRSILSEWLKLDLDTCDIKPIYFDGETFRYANSFVNKSFGIELDDEDYPIDFNKQDSYIALDLNAHLIDEAKPMLKHFKSIGMSVSFIVYDILLLQNSNWWPQGTSDVFEKWVRNIVDLADTLICISRSVADELEDWIVYNIQDNKQIPRITSFHLGADIANSLPSKGLPKDAGDVVSKLLEKPTFLTVGTIEPRKGHRQLLKAFEELWEEGYDLNLVIVGKKGWLVDELCEELENHKYLNEKLFWLNAISDEYLESVYEASTCLIAASEAEGFGLPLIEAAQKNKPLIIRDIPVFKEVAGDSAFYFNNSHNPSVISGAIKEWLSLKGEHPSSSDMKYLTWEESSKILLQKLGASR